jgi:hypothetical protein
MIECELMPLEKYGNNLETPRKIKYGRYLTSCYPFAGNGATTWPVGVNISLDYDKHEAEGTTLQEMLEGCLKYLNTPQKSKYGTRRRRKPTYGIFEGVYKGTVKEEKGKKFVQAILIVDHQKSKHFWGVGAVFKTKRRKKK